MKTLLSVLFSFIIISAAFTQRYESYKKLKDTTFQSSSLGYEKDISIVVPKEWDPSLSKRFPVILIFNKENESINNYIINTIDYITTNSQMPSCIIISVASPFKYNYTETAYQVSTSSGKAKKNEAFIFDELLPFAAEKLKANSFRLLIGHSRYGFYTTSLFVNRIQDLNAVIAFCPSYKQEKINLADSSIHYKPKNDQAVKYYRAGVESDHIEDYEEFERQVDKSYFNIKATEFKYVYPDVVPGLAIAPALYDIFNFWAEEQRKYDNRGKFNPAELAEINKNIELHYGEQMSLSIGVLNGKAWGFFTRGSYEDAIRAWELLLNEHPSFLDAFMGIISAQSEVRIDNKKRLSAFRKCVKEATYFTKKEKKELLRELR
jgi:hypothetical protein